MKQEDDKKNPMSDNADGFPVNNTAGNSIDDYDSETAQEIKELENMISSEKDEWHPSVASFMRTLSDLGVTENILGRYRSIESQEADNPEIKYGSAGRFGDRRGWNTGKIPDFVRNLSDKVSEVLRNNKKIALSLAGGLAFLMLLGLRIQYADRETILGAPEIGSKESNEIADLITKEDDTVAQLAAIEESYDFDPTIDLSQI